MRRLGRIHSLRKRIELGALLEDADAVVVFAHLVVRVFERLGHFLVGVDVDVGFDEGGGEGGFAGCQLEGVGAVFLGFNLVYDGPGVVRLALVVFEDLWVVLGLRFRGDWVVDLLCTLVLHFVGRGNGKGAEPISDQSSDDGELHSAQGSEKL